MGDDVPATDTNWYVVRDELLTGSGGTVEICRHIGDVLKTTLMRSLLLHNTAGDEGVSIVLKAYASIVTIQKIGGDRYNECGDGSTEHFICRVNTTAQSGPTFMELIEPKVSGLSEHLNYDADILGRSLMDTVSCHTTDYDKTFQQSKLNEAFEAVAESVRGQSDDRTSTNSRRIQLELDRLTQLWASIELVDPKEYAGSDNQGRHNTRIYNELVRSRRFVMQSFLELGRLVMPPQVCCHKISPDLSATRDCAADTGTTVDHVDSMLQAILSLCQKPQ
jgi:hypothetical protein